jgi:hypothetical protein
MPMGWCRRGRDVSEEVFNDLVFQVKEDTPERRSRYGNYWHRWEAKRFSGDYKMLVVLQALYPDVILTNKHASIYKQAHHLASTRLVTGLSFVLRNEREEWRVKRLEKEHDIRENGVQFLGQHDFGT